MMNFVHLMSHEMGIFYRKDETVNIVLVPNSTGRIAIYCVTDQLCMAFFDKAIGNSVQTEWSNFVSALIKLITYAKSEVRSLRMAIEILYRLNWNISLS